MTISWEVAPFILGALIEVSTPLTDLVQRRARDKMPGYLRNKAEEAEPYTTLVGDIVHLWYTFIIVVLGALFVRFVHTSQVPDLEALAYVLLLIVSLILSVLFMSADPDWYQKDIYLLPALGSNTGAGQKRGNIPIGLRRIPQLCILLNLACAVFLSRIPSSQT